MEKQMKVLFRWWKDDVIAIFPSQRDWPNPTLCGSYQQIGQHGACDSAMILRTSRPATEEEYADLKNELERVYGYNLKIVEEDNYES